MTIDDSHIEPDNAIDMLYAAVDEVFPVERKVPAFTPPTPVPVEHRDEDYARRAASWCAKSLDGKADDLAAMLPDTGRNHALNAYAYRLFRFAIAGHLDVQHVVDTLRLAALDCGLGNGEIEATLGSAQRAAERDGPQEPPIGERQADGDPFEGLVVDPVTGEIPPPELTAEQIRQRRHELAVKAELETLRARDEAKTLYAAEKAGREFRAPPSVLTLREQLQQPREATKYSVEGLLPHGGNALLTAQYKAGKTTLVTALLKSYADHLPFLGRFAVTPHPGRIAIFNYELSQNQYDQWLEDAGIEHQERVSVLHLRGYRLPLTARAVEDWIVGWLKDHDVSTWIADPFARAAVGVDENSNTEVGQWLDTFDVIKQRAGVIDGILPTHTGRAEQEAGQERARGATRLDDWADVRWILTKDDEGNRYFRATGRDVDFSEEKLSFDPLSRQLTIGGGDRAWVARRSLEDAVLRFVAANPGATSGAIELAVEGKAERVRSAVKGAIAGHRLRVEVGDKGARRHYSNEA